MPRAEITFSEEFLLEALTHHEQTKVSRRILTVIKAVCLILLLPICALLFAKAEFLGGLILVGFSVFLLFSRSLDRFFMARRFSKSPYWNSKIRVELDEVGLKTDSELGTTTVRWAAFTRTIGMKDGFLLYQGSQIFNWLPLSAFSGADRQAIVDFLRSQTKRYEEKVGSGSLN